MIFFHQQQNQGTTLQQKRNNMKIDAEKKNREHDGKQDRAQNSVHDLGGENPWRCKIQSELRPVTQCANPKPRLGQRSCGIQRREPKSMRDTNLHGNRGRSTSITARTQTEHTLLCEQNLRSSKTKSKRKHRHDTQDKKINFSY
jgi:hypothetical protein